MENKHNDLPIRIFLGRLNNVSKQDARNYCKGLVNKYFEDRENTFYSIKKSEDFIYYEVQEGGNKKSFLPAIIKFIESEGDGKIIVPSGTKNIRIKKIEDSVIFEILTEEEEDNKEKSSYLSNVKRTGRMTPIEGDKTQLLAFSLSLLMLSFILLGVSYSLYFSKAAITIENKVDFKFKSFDENIEKMKEIRSDEFISKLYFEKNRWNTEILDKDDNGKNEIESKIFEPELSTEVQREKDIERNQRRPRFIEDSSLDIENIPKPITREDRE